MFYEIERVLPDPLERLLRRETFAEILNQLTPEELIIGALRLEGLSDTQIAALLNMEPGTVSYRMIRAQDRIAAALPEAAHLLGRRRTLGKRPRGEEALEQGLICDWQAPNDRRRRPWPMRRRRASH
jgi:hypothetical protein